jgi:hypothetical protein
MGLNRIVAAIFGVVYLVAGIAGFVTNTSPLFGLFPVSLLHNVVHVVLGAILIWGMMNTASAILANRWVGVLLMVLAVVGFVAGTSLDNVVPLGGNDVYLHLVSGVILAGVSLMGGREMATA